MADSVSKKAWGSDKLQVLEDIKNVMKSKELKIEQAMDELNLSDEELETILCFYCEIDKFLKKSDGKANKNSTIQQYETLQKWHTKCRNLLIEIDGMPYNKKISFASWIKEKYKKRNMELTDDEEKRNMELTDDEEKRNMELTDDEKKLNMELTDDEKEYVKYHITGGIIAILFPYFSRAFEKPQGNDDYWNKNNNRAKKRIQYENIPWSRMSYDLEEEQPWEKYEKNINFGDLTWAERKLYEWILDNIVVDDSNDVKKQKWENIDLKKRKKLIEILEDLMDENWMNLCDMQEDLMDIIIEKLEAPVTFRINNNMKELMKIIESMEIMSFYGNNEKDESNKNDVNGEKKEEISLEYIEETIQSLTEKMREKAKTMKKEEEARLNNEVMERLKKKKNGYIEGLLKKNKDLEGQIMEIVKKEIPNIKVTTLFSDEELFKKKIKKRIKNETKQKQLLDSIEKLFIEKQKISDEIGELMGTEELIMTIEKAIQSDQED